MKKISKRRLARTWKIKDPPLKIQFEYYRALETYTRKVAAIFKEEVFPFALNEADRLSAKDAVFDAEADTLTAAFNRFLSKVSKLNKKKVNRAAVKMLNGIEVFQRNLFVKNIKSAVGVDIEAIVSQKQVKGVIDSAVKDNFDLIKSIQKSYMDRGRRIIEEGLRKGSTRKTLEKRLLNLGGFEEKYKGTEQRRARLIARDQSQKFAKAIDVSRQKKLGVRKFTWINVGDSRVRKDHAEYGNHDFYYNKPPNGELPGDKANCRCHPRPVLDDLLTALENGEISI